MNNSFMRQYVILLIVIYQGSWNVLDKHTFLIAMFYFMHTFLPLLAPACDTLHSRARIDCGYGVWRYSNVTGACTSLHAGEMVRSPGVVWFEGAGEHVGIGSYMCFLCLRAASPLTPGSTVDEIKSHTMGRQECDKLNTFYSVLGARQGHSCARTNAN